MNAGAGRWLREAGQPAIVDVALACALEAGWETTSLQAVRVRAGVSNGSLFHHFPNGAGIDVVAHLPRGVDPEELDLPGEGTLVL